MITVNEFIYDSRLPAKVNLYELNELILKKLIPSETEILIVDDFTKMGAVLKVNDAISKFDKTIEAEREVCLTVKFTDEKVSFGYNFDNFSIHKGFVCVHRLNDEGRVVKELPLMVNVKNVIWYKKTFK